MKSYLNNAVIQNKNVINYLKIEASLVSFFIFSNFSVISSISTNVMLNVKKV